MKNKYRTKRIYVDNHDDDSNANDIDVAIELRRLKWAESSSCLQAKVADNYIESAIQF